MTVDSCARDWCTTVPGYPRLGPDREFKRALERFWAGAITEAEFRQGMDSLHCDRIRTMAEAGLSLRSEAIDFHRAVPVGSIAELVARIVRVGRSSMQVEVEMWVEAMDRDERHLACEGTFTMVAVGGDGRPVEAEGGEQMTDDR